MNMCELMDKIKAIINGKMDNKISGELKVNITQEKNPAEASGNTDGHKEFDLQLHKQYAEADNNKSHNLIYFIATIGFCFAAYGYIYVNYVNVVDYDRYVSINVKEGGIHAFIAVTILEEIMLASISIISIIYGYTQRRDHFVIDRIRKKYYDDVDYNLIIKGLKDGEDREDGNPGKGNGESESTNNKSLPYQPGEKSLFSFIPDYYLAISIIALLLQVGVLFFTWSEIGWSWWHIGSILMMIAVLVFYNYNWKKYKRLG
jgi:hypothetical protein